ncbi:MAG TPA: TIGR01777 family oxidoreductase [Candidatus Acidoferrales bacterium]|nr:TIGR01777 family oxidoreductase [Candidatus Acidoferrales bacterium]
MRILVSGSTGFVGTALTEALEGQGHQLARLVRAASSRKDACPPSAQSVAWDPVASQFDAASADGADALVHLAGASIADGRWNDSRKQLLRTSRVDATRQLFGALSKLHRPPRVIVAASAIGYYGTRGDELLTEDSPSGTDFLAGVCREWETETARGAEFGARVVTLRFGIILAEHGGALAKMVMPFKLGAGGRLGDGQQWMSWITLPETVRVIQFALETAALSGPVNTVAPNPVRNSEFTTILANTLHRPALFPAPAFALRLALGEMADALLLSSQRVNPSRLKDAGYSFQQPDLAGALADVFRK